MNDKLYMRRCLQLAANGLHGARPNPMVGAVLVVPAGDGRQHDRIIGEGYHVRCGEGHAEVNAFASVRPEDEPLLALATLYVSLEPCAHYGKTPPCADLIIAKGVRRVVVGCVDPFALVQGRGIDKLRKAGIDVTVGVLEQECRWLNRRFLTYHALHRPYIILKWAQTADGFIDDHGHALQISNDYSQMLVHQLRAEEDAILVGHTTDVREHPLLTVRHWHGPSPKRIVLTHDRPLKQLIADLYQQGIQSLIVEGGRLTHESFMAAGLWDEIRIETAPVTVGDGTRAPQVPPGACVCRSAGCQGHQILYLSRSETC
ncbi:MAG: bifunctional diaminohydroxyphosphoribosylaminopyrimidine deaminase/5-amino-6-(5-phosphoribosylamino)uracil reductase RibD [Prevotella sp.]|nr:bifunctional diaminohydroxyphosphoribosylaminopyrimidine deaminase/5-amino-6-(5-phosphoribosylamino)uracil reductase RibD [Prevotella sp.]MBQ9187422.1 bifunctional diaminohydroxyphosphoribosylaminopyrimidine deaminase/5-amino-6-(5-phosphoribosylamino)uracil reductase RibD [Prevotella sp.]